MDPPKKVKQRKFESTGQYFRRLDRLVAKAKAEASLETRFDVNLLDKNANKKHKGSKNDSESLKMEKDIKKLIRSKRGKKMKKKHNKRRKGS